MNSHYKPRPVSGKMMANRIVQNNKRWHPVILLDAAHATIGTQTFLEKGAR